MHIGAGIMKLQQMTKLDVLRHGVESMSLGPKVRAIRVKSVLHHCAR